MAKRRVFVEVEQGDNIPVSGIKREGILLPSDLDYVLVVDDEVPTGGIDVSIVEGNTPSSKVIQLATNRDRLKASEICEIISELRRSGWSQREIAEKAGLSEQDVSFYVRLQASDIRITEALDEGKVKPSAVEPLLALSYEEQLSLVPSALQKKTVRGIKALIQAHKSRTSNRLIKAEEEDDLDPSAMLFTGLVSEAYKVLNSASYLEPTWDSETRREALTALGQVQALTERLLNSV